MKTKKDKFEPVGAERMTDAELSKQLGSYQRAESIGMLLGILLVIAGCIMMFVYRNIAVICILVFAGVALFLLVAKPAQTKKKALMQQQLGGFFRTELTKAFGPEPEPATLPIDWAYLKAAKLSAVAFTECTVTDFSSTVRRSSTLAAENRSPLCSPSWKSVTPPPQNRYRSGLRVSPTARRMPAPKS